MWIASSWPQKTPSGWNQTRVELFSEVLSYLENRKSPQPKGGKKFMLSNSKDAAMATSTASSGPVEAPSLNTSPTVEQLQTAFENSIWYLLSLWHPLHVACANGWGGPDSADKMDWFAGAVSDLLNTRPDTDQEDFECFLLQVMQDNFDCNVEDESEVDIARSILAVRTRMLEERTLDASREVEQRWRNRGQMKGNVKVQEMEDEVEDDGEVWEGIEEDNDEDSMEAIPLTPAAPPKKAEPEVDEDGFTKVVGKKQR